MRDDAKDGGRTYRCLKKVIKEREEERKKKKKVEFTPEEDKSHMSYEKFITLVFTEWKILRITLREGR